MCNIKICGIRRLEDVHLLNRYLPEYAGFIFAPSLRRVSLEEAKVLCGSLCAKINKVGVFVNSSVEEMGSIAAECGLDVLQLHGEEPQECIEELKDRVEGVKIWKAVRVSGPESIDALKEYRADGFLLDSYSKGSHGGTGTTFDWTLISGIPQKYDIILAGGLNSENVREACRRVRPFCLDTSSGVETGGFKDGQKIREFIDAVRGEL